MNLQRREEIRALANYPSECSVTEFQEVIRELLAHIDTLEQTAAERVIARGAAVKPHTFAEIVNQVRDIANQYAGTEQLRERIAYALTPHFERNGGPTPDYTGEGSAWVPPVEARAVVVPELTSEDLNGYSMDCDERDAVEFGYNLAASRIIPAGRVTIPPLTGGEIEARLLRLFPGISEDDPLRESCFKDSRWAYNLAVSRACAISADRVLGEGMVGMDRKKIESAASFLEEYASRVPGISAVIAALRANQGGAAT